MRRGLLPRAVLATTAVLTTSAVVAALSATGAGAKPTPTPTSAASAVARAYALHIGRSPSAPNPHPPQGGIGPDGQVVGGPALRGRGLILPAGAPALPKQLTARAWMVTDLDNGAIIAARDPHGRYQPASVLKLLAGLVMVPHLPGDRVITATAAAANAEGSAVGLVAGGRYTVDTLFKSLFLESGNDAAMALAVSNGGPARTVAEMNAEAHRLGAYDTVVQTPSGLDGWTQLTSPYDLSLILRAAVNTPRLVAYDEARTARLPAQKVGKRKWHGVPLFNESDDFLDTVPGALLVKTGYTGAAEHTYACAASRGGRRIGVVFMRNQRRPLDQYQQAAAVLNWAYALPATIPAIGRLDGALPRIASGPAPATTAANSAELSASADRARRAGAGNRAAGAHPNRGWHLPRWWYITIAAVLTLSFVARRNGRRRGFTRRHR